MLLHTLTKHGAVVLPKFLEDNTVYMTYMGSQAYGVSTDASDVDLHGVFIPLKNNLFLTDHILGFDEAPSVQSSYEKPRVNYQDKTYDIVLRDITSYFKLLCKANTSVIDSLFVRREHIQHISKSWEIVRENRNLFLSKRIVETSKGYAFSQLRKSVNCVEYVREIRAFEVEHNVDHNTTFAQAEQMLSHFDNEADYKKYMELWRAGVAKTSRFEKQKIYNQDNKFMYHIFRLLSQAEYILKYGTLDLQEPSRCAKMMDIKTGKVPFQEVVKIFHEYELLLPKLSAESSLPNTPPMNVIREMLCDVLDAHYGQVSASVRKDVYKTAVQEISKILNRIASC